MLPATEGFTMNRIAKKVSAEPQTDAGRCVAPAHVEPWPDPVGGAELLSAISNTIRRHVVLAPPTADALALWVAHTWVYELFQHTPRLSISSPERRCGKSTLLDVLRMLVCNPLKADSITASAVFRVVEATPRLTLLIDETDSFLRENEELRGVLNSGFERSGEVIRVAERGGEFQPVRFNTFAPVALAGIGALPSTLEDRSIPVALERKTATETVVRLRTPGAREALGDIARQLARWSEDRGPNLPDDPPIPDALNDREGDICVPLLSIADDASGEWPARARNALLTLFGRRRAIEGNAEAGALLLADIKVLFDGLSVKQLASAKIVKELGNMEERPWAEWRQGRPMTASQLAKALAPFGIRPSTIRIRNDTAKGYSRQAFEESWVRYLTPETPSSPGGSEPSQRHNPANSSTSGGEHAATASVTCGHRAITRDGVTGSVTDKNDGKPAENLGCDGVTAPTPIEGDGWDSELAPAWSDRL